MAKFEELLNENVNDDVETKKSGNTELKYLSWAPAWKRFKKICPDAKYDIRHWGDKPYLYDEDLGYMVETSITVEGETHSMWLPVMNSANKAMKNKPYKYTAKNSKTGAYEERTVESATMFDINNALMRCLVKNMAIFGLGLYIYEGEDLPGDNSESSAKDDVEELISLKTVDDYIEEMKALKTQKEIGHLYYEWVKKFPKTTPEGKRLSELSYELRKDLPIE